MTFVYRSPYGNPTGKFVRRFDNPSILDWFQRHWRVYDFEDESLPCITTSIFGQRICGFDLLFMDIASEQLPRPTSNRALKKVLRFGEGWHEFHKHLLEVRTNDDEWDLAFYFIDDVLLESRPECLSFMVHEEERLPTEVNSNLAKESGSDTACTYLFVQAPDHGGDQQIWDQVTVPGVRLEDFPLVAKSFAEVDAEAQTVQAHLLESATGKGSWKDAFTTLAEVDMYSDRIGNQSRFHCSAHICQLHHHAGTWDNGHVQKQLFHQVLVFDDIWAASHPDLASSIRFHASFQSLMPLIKKGRRIPN